MKKTRILVIDDESSIIKFLKVNLERNGYEVFTSLNGQDGLRTFENELPDLVILDILMPEMDGFSVCQLIRETSGVPIIMLSGRNDAVDKVKCFDLGADDYVTKPFSAGELIARVRAVIRRTALSVPLSQSVLRFGELSVESSQRKVSLSGKDIKLTPTEFKLLQVLIASKGKVMPHAELLNKVWGEEHIDETQYLHVFIKRIRTKLEPDPLNPVYIVTVPGVGYRFFHD